MNQQPATNNRQPSLKPILFSTPMVQAILNGTKTQTRRVLKEQPRNGMEHLTTYATSIGMLTVFQDNFIKHFTDTSEDQYQQRFKCPYGKPGVILWVRESFQEPHHLFPEHGYLYKATHFEPETLKWKPSIHMPYTACRLFLKINSIRVERLKSITEADAKQEGVEWTAKQGYKNYLATDPAEVFKFPTSSFESLWEKINGPDSWAANPWVWVIDFQPTEKPTA